MTILSRLCRNIPKTFNRNNVLEQLKNEGLTRQMSEHKTFVITPSRWQWHKFKDLFHYYLMVGLIPVVGIVTVTNVFVGPATLSEIPEGYTPKHWEYYKHPITRFLARYMFPNPQQEYEKYMHYIYEESERQMLRKLEKQVRDKMAERNDYQAYYYTPAMAKYIRASRESADYLKNIRGD